MARKGHGNYSTRGKAKPRAAAKTKSRIAKSSGSGMGQPRAAGRASGMGHNSALC